MSIFRDISAALDSSLNTAATGTAFAVAWENSDYTPASNAYYMRPTLMPGTTQQAGLGASGLDQHLGVYQVDIVVPASTNKAAAITQADLIAEQFKRGTILTYGGVSLRLSKTSRGTGRVDGAYFTIPVNVTYQSFTNPR